MLHTLHSTGFKSGEFGGHSSGEMNYGVSLSRNSTVARAFGVTSNLHDHYVESCKSDGRPTFYRPIIFQLP